MRASSASIALLVSLALGAPRIASAEPENAGAQADEGLTDPWSRPPEPPPPATPAPALRRAPPPPPAPTFVAPAEAPVPMSDRVFQLKLAQLPSRPGTIVLGILGGLLMAGGSAQLLAGATLPCREIDRYDEACTSDFPTRWRLLGVGAAQLVLGTIMIGFTVRLSHRRHDGLRELEQATLARGVDPSLTFGLALGDPRALPSMTLRF